jgi:hypothetical protein
MVFENTIFSAACQMPVNSRSEDPLAGHCLGGLPVEHRLVHPAPVEVGTDGTLEVIDEAEQLLTGGRPVEGSGGVFDVTVCRGDRRVDQFGHQDISAFTARAV